MNLSIKSPISVENYFSADVEALRRVNTNIFYYLLFFTIGLIAIIVAACIYGQGIDYGTQGSANLGWIHADSNVVLGDASTSLFIVGGLFVGFPIFINIYAIQKIYKTPILKKNVPIYIIALLISGVILQITTFIGMILLYPIIKKLYATYKNK